MSLPDFDTLAIRSREIVLAARKAGNLKDLTPNVVFGQMDEEYGLESETVGQSEYKKQLRRIIKEAATAKLESEDDDIAELEPEEPVEEAPEPISSKKHAQVESDEEFEEQEEKPKPVKKAAPAKKAEAKKRKAPVISDEEADIEVGEESHRPKKTLAKKRKVSVASDEEAEESEPAPKKPRSKPASKKPTSARPESTRRSSKQKIFTSAEFVEDSDDDATAAPKSGSSSTKVDDAPQPKAKRTTAKKAKITKPMSDDDVEVVEKAAKPKSDSELSALEDEPPKKGRMSKPAKAAQKASKAPKKSRGKAKEPLSKNEEKIERLKGFVRECGVRKVWAKEFRDLDKPAQRIERLERILRDLGMTGRFTVSQAREIKERRELASELQDVQSFEKAFTGKKRGAAAAPDEEGSGDDAPAAKRVTARARIAAFLADQSDDE